MARETRTGRFEGDWVVRTGRGGPDLQVGVKRLCGRNIFRWPEVFPASGWRPVVRREGRENGEVL